MKKIKKVPMQQKITQKKDDMVQAERSGDHRAAAQIAIEIIRLEKKLKLSAGKDRWLNH
jgi:DNA primase